VVAWNPQVGLLDSKACEATEPVTVWSQRRGVPRRQTCRGAPLLCVRASMVLRPSSRRSVEHSACPCCDDVIDGFEVAPHRRGRVSVTEYTLDVEQVEVMGSRVVCASMQDPCCGAAQIVRR
jgi:hypothetical protein